MVVDKRKVHALFRGGTAAPEDDVKPRVVALPFAQAEEPVAAAGRNSRIVEMIRENAALFGVVYCGIRGAGVVDVLVVRRLKPVFKPVFDVAGAARQLKRPNRLEVVAWVQGDVFPGRNRLVERLVEVAPAVVHSRRGEELSRVGRRATADIKGELRLCVWHNVGNVAHRRIRHACRKLPAKCLRARLLFVIVARRNKVGAHRRNRRDYIVEENKATFVNTKG